MCLRSDTAKLELLLKTGCKAGTKCSTRRYWYLRSGTDKLELLLKDWGLNQGGNNTQVWVPEVRHRQA